jgi:cell wall-associated NlpC family hydrolase
MFINRLYIIIVAIFLSVFLLTGCASTSNVSRYGEKSDSETHKTNNVRFSSDKDGDDNKVAASGRNDSVSIHNLEDESDPDELPANEPKIDASSVLRKISSANNSGDLSADNGTAKEKMLMEILKYINTPYKYGGTSSNGIDCSAFTQAVFSKSLSIRLDRTARGQYHEGQEVDDINDLQFGDLVFFNTSRREKPGHVGIYIGDHLFVHAARSGVTVSSLDMDYYAKRFMGGRRIEPDQFGSK